MVGNKAFIFYRDKSTEDSGMETGGNDGSVSTGDSDNSIEITPLKKNEGISKRTVTEDGKVAARAYYKSKGLSGYAFPMSRMWENCPMPAVICGKRCFRTD